MQDTYHFKDSIKDLEVQDSHSDLMGTLGIIGMFPNIVPSFDEHM